MAWHTTARFVALRTWAQHVAELALAFLRFLLGLLLRLLGEFEGRGGGGFGLCLCLLLTVSGGIAGVCWLCR
jgi:hypothetical protein